MVHVPGTSAYPARPRTRHAGVPGTPEYLARQEKERERKGKRKQRKSNGQRKVKQRKRKRKRKWKRKGKRKRNRKGRRKGIGKEGEKESKGKEKGKRKGKESNKRKKSSISLTKILLPVTVFELPQRVCSSRSPCKKLVESSCDLAVADALSRQTWPGSTWVPAAWVTAWVTAPYCRFATACRHR